MWLPVDDGAVLGLVLSKAFLLADTAITDDTILAQIKRR